MPRRRGGARVRGPYPHGSKWRIELIDRNGERVVESFPSKSEAERAIKAARLVSPEQLVGAVLDKYELFLRGKGNKPYSIETTMLRLNRWLDKGGSIGMITERQLRLTYDTRAAEVAVDSHRNELGQVKTFFRWCLERGYVAKSPAEGVKGVGKRRVGKPQLRRGALVTLARYVEHQAVDSRSESAVAILATLLLGVRASEILERRVRDVDICDDMTLLWIDEGKTAAASRHLEVPEPLASCLIRQAANRPSDAWLFPSDASTGHRERTWLRKAAMRLCREAGVDYVCPHGLRGTHATLAIEAGLSPAVVARALGHASERTTIRHYAERGTVDRARVRSLLQVVK